MSKKNVLIESSWEILGESNPSQEDFISYGLRLLLSVILGSCYTTYLSTADYYDRYIPAAGTKWQEIAVKW